MRGQRRDGIRRRFDGAVMTQRQVAEELGISVSSVCQAELRALSKLRQALGQEQLEQLLGEQVAP